MALVCIVFKADYPEGEILKRPPGGKKDVYAGLAAKSFFFGKF